MKKFLVVLVLLAFAATSFAVELKLSGNFYVRGTYIKGADVLDGKTNNDVSYSYYDQDMNLWAKLVVDENTWVTTRFAIHDETWKNDPYNPDNNRDVDVSAERAWLTHKFATGTTLDAGLMSGGGWGPAFGNTVGGKYRIKLTQSLALGSIVGWVEKKAEKGAYNVKDAEKDDSDSYALGGIFTVSGIKIMPLIVYTVDSTQPLDNDTDAQKTLMFDLAATGELGIVGFEAEFIYKNISEDRSNYDDYNVFGIYANAYGKLGKAKVGLKVAYGSVDDDVEENGTKKDKPFTFGDDFDMTLVLDDLLGLGGGEALFTATGMGGVTAIQAYVDASVMEKLTTDASFTFVSSNYDDDDSKAYEVDLGATYSITKNLSYRAAIGYAKIDADSGSDPDPIIRAYHKISLSF